MEEESLWSVEKGSGHLEEYKSVVRACRDAVRTVKAQLELNLAREVKDKRKGFVKYISSKRKTGQCGCPGYKGH